MTGEKRRRGPAPRISRSAVLDAARGLPSEQLTMAAIGAELGVTSPAIYRYFPDRAALVEALAQEALDRLEPPDPSLPWREWLLEAARRHRAFWAKHPELHEASNRRATARPTIHMFEAGLKVLSSAGFSSADALCGMAAVVGLADSVGWAESQIDALIAPDDAAEMAQLKKSLDVTITPDTLFEQTIEFVLDGLAARVAPRSRRRFSR